jgi:hypothetical protein
MANDSLMQWPECLNKRISFGRVEIGSRRETLFAELLETPSLRSNNIRQEDTGDDDGVHK